MESIVCKFGGSSVATSEGFRQIKRILDEEPSRRYIVLSAPGSTNGSPKVTDLLEAVWNEGGHGPASASVVRRFHDISAGLGLVPRDELIRNIIASAAKISLAHTLSRGEYLCARLFADFAGLPFIDAAPFVCFDAQGTLDVPRSVTRLSVLPSLHLRAVLPGFYGTDTSGRVVTLPRNGSDITGALVAAAVKATLYENWTDVPGLMTDDPDANPNARLIPVTDYPEMRRFALNGARILHPDCLAPVENAGIPTRLKCTMAPDAPGTLIHV